MINIYLICCEYNDEKLYKIGFTKRDISVRMKEFKTGNAGNLYLVDSFKSKWGVKIESRLKKQFSKYNINGEWFLLNDNDVKSFKEICEEIHNNFTFLSKNNNFFIEE